MAYHPTTKTEVIWSSRRPRPPEASLERPARHRLDVAHLQRDLRRGQRGAQRLRGAARGARGLRRLGRRAMAALVGLIG